MKLGLINSAWAQTGRDTAWGIRKTKELGFDTIDIFADPLDIDVRERKLIKKIESTLELIDQDEYGYCEECGVDIGIKRLEARPTATLCIDCKTLDEMRERQVAK